MNKWIYVVMFIIGGAISASLGLQVFGIYAVGLSVFLLVVWLSKVVKTLPKKAFDYTNKKAQERLAESPKGKPYITVHQSNGVVDTTTHLGPNGVTGLEYGLHDEEDGQIGTGPLNPTEVTRDMFRMKTAEANAEIATAIRDIVNSNLPYHLKQSAIEQLDTSKNFSGTPKSKPRKPRLRQTGEDVVGLSSGNYSIE